MAFDYNKLRGRIVEIFNTQSNFASAMGWSERILSLKMNGMCSWKQIDICKAIQLLKLTIEDIPIVQWILHSSFFTLHFIFPFITMSLPLFSTLR